MSVIVSYTYDDFTKDRIYDDFYIFYSLWRKYQMQRYPGLRRALNTNTLKMTLSLRQTLD